MVLKCSFGKCYLFLWGWGSVVIMIRCIMFLSQFQDTPVMFDRSLKLTPYLFHNNVALYFEPSWKPENEISLWCFIKLND